MLQNTNSLNAIRHTQCNPFISFPLFIPRTSAWPLYYYHVYHGNNVETPTDIRQVCRPCPRAEPFIKLLESCESECWNEQASHGIHVVIDDVKTWNAVDNSEPPLSVRFRSADS